MYFLTRSLAVKHLHYLQLCDDVVHERLQMTAEQQIELASLAVHAESFDDELKSAPHLEHFICVRLYQSLGHDAILEQINEHRQNYGFYSSRMNVEEAYLEVSKDTNFKVKTYYVDKEKSVLM